MRRAAFCGVLSAMALVLVGCPTQPPGYRPPSIVSVEISPQPAQPGDTMTMLIEVLDDELVSSVVLRSLTTPSHSSLRGSDHCTIERTPIGTDPAETRRHVLATVTCTIPTFASNGTWKLELFLNDSMPPTANYPGRTTHVSFDVVGGSDDRRSPQLVSYEITPTVVDQETVFTLTMRLRDESLPISIAPNGGSIRFGKLFAPQSAFNCSPAVMTPVSATEVDAVAECVPSNYNNLGRSEVGLHRAFPPVVDALGHEGNIEMLVDVVPATSG